MDAVCKVINQSTYDASEIAHKIYDSINIDGCKNIFIKPNLVINPWKGEEDNWIATVTHISLIEAVLMVLKSKSISNPINVVIGDAPMARTNIDIVLKLNNLKSIVNRYSCETMKVSLIDIREWHWKYIAEMCVSRIRLPGDPKGNVYVNLHKHSMFVGKESLNFEAFDNIQPVGTFHNLDDNIYSISASVLESDLFINLPKMKTHRIAGMTCAMKNLVGINSNKNCVPHNTRGTVSDGGDESPENDINALNESKGIGGIARRVFRRKYPIINYAFIPFKMLYDKLNSNKKQLIGYGMWYGNDTMWRSIIDLNRILLYCDKNGNMHEKQQRKYVCITDAIVSGEAEGPLHPIPKKTNMLLVSYNPLVMDAVTCEIMGFDYKKIPTLYNAINLNYKYSLFNSKRDDIYIEYKKKIVSINDIRDSIYFDFIPTHGWKGHIEK